MITQRQLEISAKAYAILAAGKKYELLVDDSAEWKGPFGLDSIEDNSPFGEGAIDVREAQEPLVRFHVIVNAVDGDVGFDDEGFAKKYAAKHNGRVVRMIEDKAYTP